MAVFEEEDRVDQIVQLWSTARPDLDCGLFDVLATLRRIGPPCRLSPGELDDWCMLTSVAMTARLARL